MLHVQSLTLHISNHKLNQVGVYGDDSWMSVFPDTFEANMTFPFDSCNVEDDLHTIDEGVIRHFFPLPMLSDRHTSFFGPYSSL